MSLRTAALFIVVLMLLGEEAMGGQGWAMEFPSFAESPLPENCSARLGSTLWKHDEFVWRFACSPDGKYLAACTRSGSARIWDMATVKTIKVFNNPHHRLYYLAFSANGRTLALVGSGPSVMLCDIPTMKCEEIKLFDPAPVGIDFHSVAFSPDGTKLAVGVDRYGQVHIIDLQMKKMIRTFEKMESPPLTLQFFPDGKELAVSGGSLVYPPQTSPTPIHVCDITTGNVTAKLEGHQSRVPCLALTGDNKTLISASFDGTIRFWDLQKRQQSGSLPQRADCLSISPDRRLLAAAGTTDICLWDLSTKKLVKRIPTDVKVSPTFSSDGKLLLAPTGGLSLWRVPSGEKLPTPEGHTGGVLHLAFSPDSEFLASEGVDRTIRMWDLTTRKQIYLIDLMRDFRGYSPWESVRGEVHLAFSPDGRVLAAIPGPARPRFWRAASGDLIGDPLAEPRLARGLLFSPDKKTFCTLGEETKTWPIPNSNHTARPVNELPGREREKGQYIRDVVGSFSPDGKTLTVMSADWVVRTWDCVGKRLLRTVKLMPTVGGTFSFSPDARLVASYDKTDRAGQAFPVYLYELGSGTLLRQLEGHEAAVTGVAFSPDGAFLASSSRDGTVRIWDFATGKERRCFRGHDGAVLCVAFSPDGRTVASGGSDTTILLWDVGTLAAPAAPKKPDELKSAWDELLRPEAERGYPAVAALAEAGDQAVAFVKERVRAVPAPDPERVRKLIKDLNDSNFDTREAATRALIPLFELIEPELQKELEGKPPAEVVSRLERIREEGGKPFAQDEALRALRAVVVLEQVGTPAAREALEVLARGAPAARLTQEARDAVLRLKQRKPRP
jgi:WD40 repeat protein